MIKKTTVILLFNISCSILFFKFHLHPLETLLIIQSAMKTSPSARSANRKEHHALTFRHTLSKEGHQPFNLC